MIQNLPNSNEISILNNEIATGKTDIAAAINNMGGTASSTDTFTELAEAIEDIQTGPDVSSDTVTADKMLSGITAHDANGNAITGTIPSVTHPSPTASIDSSTGVVTASHAQSTGYVTGGTTTKTLSLTTQAAKTVTPGTSSQTAVAAGCYTTGAVTVEGDANLTAANIKSGTAIFGVTGTFQGGPVSISGTYTKVPDLNSLARSTPTTLSSDRYSLAGASVGNYALFCGGFGDSTYSAVVDAYNTSLTRSTPPALGEARSGPASASVGNYALFGGGTFKNFVDAYDTSLTRSTPAALSQARSGLEGASVGNYALFGGGGLNSNNTIVTTVDAYDTSLTRSTPTALGEKREDLAGASVGNYALFGGGNAGGYADKTRVDAYDRSLTRSKPTALSEARSSSAGVSVGNYALFGGGHIEGDTVAFAAVDAYNTSLTRSTPTELSERRRHLAGASVGNYALFGGGLSNNSRSISVSTVDAYDASLTRSTPTTLSSDRYSLAGASVGNYALFGGGYYGDSTYSAVVDAYGPGTKIQFTVSDVSLPDPFLNPDSGTITGGVTLS